MHDYDVIVNDPEVQIVAEVMGGVEPAFSFSRRALEAGKSVCTSNKELVARHGTELIALAKEHHASYMFEASCGGGIPVIRPLRTCLSQEMLDEITDEELLHLMKEQYEEICFGDLDYLESTCLANFAQAVRAGYGGYKETQGYGEASRFDEVKRWDYDLYLEALKELCWR